MGEQIAETFCRSAVSKCRHQSCNARLLTLFGNKVLSQIAFDNRSNSRQPDLRLEHAPLLDQFPRTVQRMIHEINQPWVLSQYRLQLRCGEARM